MSLSNDQLAIIIIWGIILLSIIGIIWFIVSPKLRLKSKKFLPPSTTIFGATHVFQNQDKKSLLKVLLVIFLVIFYKKVLTLKNNT